MVDEVTAMSQAEIDSLSDEEVLKLGTPIIKAFENTVKFDQETLNRLREATQVANEHPKSLTKTMYNVITKEVKSILASSASKFEKRKIDVDNVRTQLINIQRKNGAMESAFDCETWFNVAGNTVYLYPGDYFGLANGLCPAGSQFNAMPGIHYGQSVSGSKNGNSWTGFEAIMDGQESTQRAFENGMNNNRISFFEIWNYTRHGIYSDGSNNVEMIFLRFLNIAHDYCQTPECGQNEGAIMFTNSEDISVQYNNFLAVASGVRFRDSEGPLVVKNNEAVNSGRNFFQCDNCSGGGIRINRNSMERTAQFGDTMLEDWINIYQSEGNSNDWIQVNDNRAQGHSSSGSGSFIMLGDHGGNYQEAVDNIGVNPGQVGIGAHGGDNMYVAGNKMFSESWSESNVAFSSYNATSSYSCKNHDFENNTANWTCGDSDHCDNPPTLNNAWANDDCGLSGDEIDAETTYDSNMDETVWNEW
jgi:hypothetical protein